MPGQGSSGSQGSAGQGSMPGQGQPSASGQDTSGQGTVVQPGQPPDPSAATVKDEDIASIIVAGNKAEVDEARVAQTRAATPEVKIYAAQMVTKHGAAMDQMNILVKRLKMTPNDANATSQQMATESKSTVDTLKQKVGKEFDRVYIDATVKDHQNLIRVIDLLLLPNAKNADVRAQLQRLRPQIEQHLKMALAIQAKLANDMSGGGAPNRPR